MPKNTYLALGDPPSPGPYNETFDIDSGDDGVASLSQQQQQQQQPSGPLSLLGATISGPAAQMQGLSQQHTSSVTGSEAKILPPVSGKMHQGPVPPKGGSHTIPMPDFTDEFGDANPLGAVDSEGGAGGNGSDRTQQTKFWHLAYYSKYFDVDTKELLHRMRLSLFPNSKFNSAIGFRVEMYGPFWLPATLSLSLFVASSFQNLLRASGEDHKNGTSKPSTDNGSGGSNKSNEADLQGATVDVKLLGFAATTVSTYTCLAPVLIFLYSKYISKNMPFYELVCIYGYAMTLWIPVSILCAIDINILRWVLLSTAYVVSSLFISKALRIMLSASPESPTRVQGLQYWLPIGFCWVAHLAFMLTLKFVFFF